MAMIDITAMIRPDGAVRQAGSRDVLVGGGARREPAPQLLLGQSTAVVAARARILALDVALVPGVNRRVGDGARGVELAGVPSSHACPAAHGPVGRSALDGR